MNKRYSILTVNFGGYEKIEDPLVVLDDVEYVCVTDDMNLKSDVWKIIYRPNMWFLYPKHHPFEFVTTDVCLWLDGSYKLIGDTSMNLMDEFIASDFDMSISLHNCRHNIYEELAYWLMGRNMSLHNSIAFLQRITSECFNSDTLFQTSCILVKKTPLTDMIWKTVCDVEEECSVEGNYRDDQTLFSYSIVKNAYRSPKIRLMNFEKTCCNSNFYWRWHGTDYKHIEVQKSIRCFDLDIYNLYNIK